MEFRRKRPDRRRVDERRRLDRRSGGEEAYGGADRRVGRERRSGGDRRYRERRAADRVATVRKDVRQGHADRLRRAAVGLLACWAFVATVGVVALAFQTHIDDLATQRSASAVRKSSAALLRANAALERLQQAQARQHVQLLQGCERLNIQRATANASNASQYTIDRIFFLAVRAQRRHQTALERRFTRQFLRAERSALRGLRWTPLTDCVGAVAISGSAYRAPRPVAFFTRLPPASALDTQNASLPVPIGSLP